MTSNRTNRTKSTDINADMQTSTPDIQTSISDSDIQIPDGFPPKGQYTAKAIAEDFGFDPSGIEKYYYPEAIQIYQVCPQVLKVGHLFSQTFYDLMYLFRQHRMREKMLLNAKGQIVRHAPEEAGKKGKPVLEKNSARMTAAQFRDWFWEKHQELIPAVAEDSPQAAQVEVIADNYDPETDAEIDGALTKAEEFGTGYEAFKTQMVQQFRLGARELVADCANAFQEELTEGMGDFFKSVGQATTPGKAKKRTK